jgi:hypothetical protein
MLAWAKLVASRAARTRDFFMKELLVWFYSLDMRRTGEGRAK